MLPDVRAEDSVTRALTIHAPVDAVWPWLAQLGPDRGGFYSYELLEDLAGCEMEHADRILPGKQGWAPGDSLWMYPPTKLGGVGGAPLVRQVPGRALAFAATAVATLLQARGWPAWALVTTAASTLLCILALPDTRVGLAVHLVLLALLLWLQARVPAT